MHNAVWKARFFNLARGAAQRLYPLLQWTGLERVRLIRDLRHGLKLRMIRRLESGSLLLIEIDGLAMYIFNRPHFIGVHLSGSYEPYTLKLFKDAVRPGATVLDIGANIGYFTLVAARQSGASGRVYAFEPGPENFQVLARNIEINKFRNVTAVPKAVGDRSEIRELVLGEDSDQHSLFGPPMVPRTGAVAVECLALDGFLQDSTPDVIKLDVEGNELFALEGMRGILGKSEHLVMFVELNPVCLRQANMEPEDLISKLHGFGFEIHIIDENLRSLNLLPDDYLRRIRAEPPGWFVNLYCTKGRRPPVAASNKAG
jgi:FkbM family methyltransferase